MIALSLQERKVFLFLSVMVLLGLAVGVWRKRAGENFCSADLFLKNETSRPVDINRAGLEELEGLPVVGRKTAEAIIAYRTAQGGFRSLDELKEIKGISAAKFERLKNYFYI